jgi:DNA-binding PucR family transcriptional regulator
LKQRQLIFYEEVFLEHLAALINDDIPLYSPAVLLREYDDENKTDYCLTLFTWLTHERNNVRTAAKLFIHRNTLKYRLERIQEIVSCDMDVFEKRERLVHSLNTLLQDGEQ